MLSFVEWPRRLPHIEDGGSSCTACERSGIAHLKSVHVVVQSREGGGVKSVEAPASAL